jgi:HK97 family phage portal protein
MSFDGVVGLSPIEYVSSAIRLGLTYESFGNRFYQNGANSSGAFTHPGVLNEEAYQRLKKDLEKNYTGVANTGKPLLLEDGMKFEMFSIKPVDAQLLESKRFQIEDVARIYRVPMHLIQELTRATFSNIEHQSLEFQIFTMLPWVQRWEQAINSQLLTIQDRQANYYVELNMNAMLRGDLKSRYEAYATGIQWGILSINDCLRLENMNSIGPDGDRHIQPLNMISISKADDYYTKQTDQGKAMVDKMMNLLERRE